MTDDIEKWTAWSKQHVEAMDRFIAGEDDLAAFTAKLEALGFGEPELSSEIDHARAERAQKSTNTH